MAYDQSQFVNSNNSYSGNIKIDAILECGTGGIISFFLYGGASGNGYLFKFDSTSGNKPGRIFSLASGAATDIGTVNTALQAPFAANNAAQLTGAHHVVCLYRKVTGKSAKLSITVNGVLIAYSTDNTYTVAGQVGYGEEVAAGFISKLAVTGHHVIMPHDQDANALALIDFNSVHANVPSSAHDTETGTTTLTRNQFIVVGLISSFALTKSTDIVRFSPGAIIINLVSFDISAHEIDAEIIVDGSGAIGAQVSGGTQVEGRSFPVKIAGPGGTSSPTLTGSVAGLRYAPGDTSAHSYRLCVSMNAASALTGTVTYCYFELQNSKVT